MDRRVASIVRWTNTLHTQSCDPSWSWAIPRGIVCLLGVALPQRALAQELQPLPPRNPAPISRNLEPAPEDPLLKAIQERAALTSKPSDLPEAERSKVEGSTAITPQVIRRKKLDRWHVAENLLRQARKIARHADAMEFAGNNESVAELRSIAQSLREQAARLISLPLP